MNKRIYRKYHDIILSSEVKHREEVEGKKRTQTALKAYDNHSTKKQRRRRRGRTRQGSTFKVSLEQIERHSGVIDTWVTRQDPTK